MSKNEVLAGILESFSTLKLFMKEIDKLEARLTKCKNTSKKRQNEDLIIEDIVNVIDKIHEHSTKIKEELDTHPAIKNKRKKKTEDAVEKDSVNEKCEKDKTSENKLDKLDETEGNEVDKENNDDINATEQPSTCKATVEGKKTKTNDEPNIEKKNQSDDEGSEKSEHSYEQDNIKNGEKTKKGKVQNQEHDENSDVEASTKINEHKDMDVDEKNDSTGSNTSDPLRNSKSPVFGDNDTSDKQEAEELTDLPKKEIEDVKPQIRLVDLNKLMDPKPKKSVKFDSSLIIISSDEEHSPRKQNNDKNGELKSALKNSPLKVNLKSECSISDKIRDEIKNTKKRSQNEDSDVVISSSDSDIKAVSDDDRKTRSSRRIQTKRSKVLKRQEDLKKIFKRKGNKNGSSSFEIVNDSSKKNKKLKDVVMELISESSNSDSDEDIEEKKSRRNRRKGKQYSAPAPDDKCSRKLYVPLPLVECDKLKEVYLRNKEILEIKRLTSLNTLKKKRRPSLSESEDTDSNKESGKPTSKKSRIASNVEKKKKESLDEKVSSDDNTLDDSGINSVDKSKESDMDVGKVGEEVLAEIAMESLDQTGKTQQDEESNDDSDSDVPLKKKAEKGKKTIEKNDKKEKTNVDKKKKGKNKANLEAISSDSEISCKEDTEVDEKAQNEDGLMDEEKYSEDQSCATKISKDKIQKNNDKKRQVSDDEQDKIVDESLEEEDNLNKGNKILEEASDSNVGDNGNKTGNNLENDDEDSKENDDQSDNGRQEQEKGNKKDKNLDESNGDDSDGKKKGNIYRKGNKVNESDDEDESDTKKAKNDTNKVDESGDESDSDEKNKENMNRKGKKVNESDDEDDGDSEKKAKNDKDDKVDESSDESDSDDKKKGNMNKKVNESVDEDDSDTKKKAKDDKNKKVDECSDESDGKKKGKINKKCKKVDESGDEGHNDTKEKQKQENDSDEDDSNDAKKKEKKKWRKEKLLTEKMDSTDTEEEREKLCKKKSKKEISDSDDDEPVVKKPTRRKFTRKAKKVIISDSDQSGKDNKKGSSSEESEQESGSSNDDDKKEIEEEEPKKKQTKRRIRREKCSSSDDDDDKSTRKNIRRLMDRSSLSENTIKAEEEEKKRKARIAEKQKKYNAIIEDVQNSKVEKLILEYDEKKKKDLLPVHKHFISKLKPHQANGVRFMWDACFESLDRCNKEGSGCILAHCMGLGKTLQVITLTHTLLTHSEKSGVTRVMVVCPINTVLNWKSEFKMWMPKNNSVEVYELVNCRLNSERQYYIKEWFQEGGVLIIGYTMFRMLSNPDNKKISKKIRAVFHEGLVDPGPDLVVCDEGHLLKNEKTNLSIAMNRIRTKRRIVLTGTPLQNNLKEYWCMVQFIKPNLLGTYKEYLNRFVNPITNGQYTDSTQHDIVIMRKRSHVLHKLLDGVVQRRDYSVLEPYLPPKHEYVLFVKLTDVQIKLYKHYMDRYARKGDGISNRTSFLFTDFQNLQRLCTHPRALGDRNYDKKDKDTDEESIGSLKDFIDDDAATPSGSGSSSSGSDSDSSESGSDKEKENKSQKNTFQQRSRVTRALAAQRRENNEESDPELEEIKKEWWQEYCDGEELENINNSGKLFLLFQILKECEEIGDKVLVFSQSLFTLNCIEYFLEKVDEATQNGNTDKIGGLSGSWALGLDYFRLDGSSSCDNRAAWCNEFNNPDNTRARLFLISTKAGGLGINLVAANRVIIFDVSWNPSHDIQSIYRVYRFGQTKPCYIYRFVTYGAMEMKIYERQVTKQAISKRVIDEQQIDRHYNQNDLQELYKCEVEPEEERPIPLVPKDVLLGELLQKLDKTIYKYHLHQSLLENKTDEGLNEEERKAAWEEFESEKVLRKTTSTWNAMGVSMGLPQLPMNAQTIAAALTNIVRKDNPTWSEIQIKGIIPALVRQLQVQMSENDMSMYTRVLQEIEVMQAALRNQMTEAMYQQQVMRAMQEQQRRNLLMGNPQRFAFPGNIINMSHLQRPAAPPSTSNAVIELND